MASLNNFRLVVFRAVAEQLSFREGADELYLTQPAVSLQIKALEEDLGVHLFERTGTRIALTEAGSVLLERFAEASAVLARAEHEIGRLSGKFTGKLALGASSTIAQYVLPRLLGEFCRQNPRVRASVIGGNTEEIVAALEQGKVSLGMIEGPSRSRDVKAEPFLEDELILIVPAGHEWAEMDSIECAQIGSAPLLLRERGSGTRRVVELALAHAGVKRRSLHVAMEIDSTEAIKSAVEAGLGVGFVSRWAVAKDRRLGAGFKIVEVRGVRMKREFCVACLTGREPQGLANEFRRFLFSRTWRKKGRNGEG